MLDVGDIPGLGDHSAGLISFGPECCTMSMPGGLSRSTTLAEAAGRTKVGFTMPGTTDNRVSTGISPRAEIGPFNLLRSRLRSRVVFGEFNPRAACRRQGEFRGKHLPCLFDRV
jgi:hypothetical protein